MITVTEALTRLLGLVRPMEAEVVPLTSAAGRVLAADAVALRTQPPFNASAMDGYAVRVADAAAGATLRVVGEAAAGHRHDGAMPPGSAVRIFTGAVIPPEADAILIQENAVRDGEMITVTVPPEPGQWVRAAGIDFAAGDRITAPRRLTSRDVALLAAMNLAQVSVARRPLVALIRPAMNWSSRAWHRVPIRS